MGESATASPDIAASANPFAPQHCPDCGYSLTGLASAGRCPECGTPYDETMIVIYGFGAAGRKNAINRRATESAWRYWLGVCAPLAFLAWIWLVRGQRRTFTFYAIVFVSMSAITFWRRRAIGLPKPVQLRLLRSGFAQRNGFGTVRVHPWTSWGLPVRVHRWDTNRWVLEIARPWLVPQFQSMAGVEFDATPEVAMALGRQIEDWIGVAGAKGKVRFRAEYPWWRLTSKS